MKVFLKMYIGSILFVFGLYLACVDNSNYFWFYMTKTIAALDFLTVYWITCPKN